MSENSLVEQKQNSLVPQEFQSTTELGTFDEVANSFSFLPYIQLCGSSSNAVKEGRIAMGHFALGQGQELNDIGDEFIAVVINWRPKALRFNPRLVVYKTEDEDFQMIKKAALSKKEEIKRGHCFGPEFLLWLPDYKTFAVYHLNNPTGRNEAGNVSTYVGNACKLFSHLIRDKGTGNTWHGPKAAGFGGEVPLPDWEASRDTIEGFKTPSKYQEDKEKVEDDGRER